MAVTAQRGADGRTLTIRVDGRFDFSSHQDFRNAYVHQGQPGDAYVLDLARTEYLDSSALGMMLLLREHAGGDAARVQIVNCRPEIRQILAIANFQLLFALD